MKYDAGDPHWPDRDRFVLSAGHASILLYSMLHLTGLRPEPRRPACLPAVGIEDARATRSGTTPTASRSPPARSGRASGTRWAWRWPSASCGPRVGADLVDHRTFCVVGDGDLSEGLSHEAASLAGHLGLGRLVCVYDDNHVSIDGPTELSLSDDAAARFAAYGWHVEDLGEAAEDLDAIEAALQRAVAEEDRPSLVIVRSHIAFPSPSKTDDPATHGYALKDAEISEAKAAMGLPDEPFYVPDDVRELYRAAGARGRDEREAWQKRLDAYDGDQDLADRAAGRHRAARAGPTPCPPGRPATRPPPGWPAARCCRRSPTSCRPSSPVVPT